MMNKIGMFFFGLASLILICIAFYGLKEKHEERE